MRQYTMTFYHLKVFFSIVLCFTAFMSNIHAEEISSQEYSLLQRESQNFVIKGVYYLINQNDFKSAEIQFRKAILLDKNNKEAYYFLGRTYYEQATSTKDISDSQQNKSIAKAKALLLEAQKLGITYDKLHPEILSKIKHEYPEVIPVYEEELLRKKAKIVIESNSKSFQKIQVSKVNSSDEVLQVGTFQPEEKITFDADTFYRLEFLSESSKFKHLVLLGVGLAVWFIR